MNNMTLIYVTMYSIVIVLTCVFTVMAITSYEYVSDRNGLKSSCSKYSNINPLSSTKISCTTNSSLTSNNKCNKTKINKYISPYFSDDRVQLLSRVTEKRFLHKKHDFMSSFPLAVNIYKANSDDLRSSKRFSKKVKKSVLTLPNEPTPLPQACTVSDMNDSEYFNDDKISIKPKQKKKRVVQSRKKSRVCNSLDFKYESNAKNYSQTGNILHKSSKDVLNFTGGDVMKLKRSANNNTTLKSTRNAHDVWTLLRDINHFKFVPSPPVSQESSVISVIKVKKRKNNKQRSNRKDTRFIETCRTEEFAYISSFVDNSPISCSQSSFDRITVIEKQNEIENINCSAVENQIECPTNSYRYHSGTTRNIDKSKKSKSKQSNLKGGIHSVKSNDKIIIGRKLLPEMQRNNVPCQNKNKKYQNSEIVQQKTFESNENNLMETSLSNNVNINQNKINDFSNNRSNVSVKSNSSKEGIINCKNKMISSRILLENLTPNESQQDVTGITKVVLSKGQKILLTKQIAALQRKSRTTTPVNSEKPKISLTLSEIKRKIRSIRFPLVILAKDQLSSAIRVENYDPPQFTGLDEHIWPFMRLWCGNSDENLQNSSNKKINYYSNLNSEALNTNEHYTNGKDQNNNLPIKKKEKSLIRIKSIHKIKNRMMELMHKKTCLDNEVYYSINNGQTVDIGVNTVNDLISLKRYSTELRKDTEITKNNSTSISYAKTKRKWGSDFIENVIQKIKNGIYYSYDDKAENRAPCNNMKEDGVQTDIENIKTGPSCDFINEVKNETYSDIDKIVIIPGFDNRFSDLEIETLNHFNRVEVKHCVANIIIQFDVALSFESDRILQIKQSHPCVPVSLDENQPTIFKCKTTIINAILPAELCSILPKIMENIIHLNSKLALSSSTINNNSNLSTITEITHCESDSNKYSIPVHIDPKLKMNNVSEGNFASPYIIKTVKRENIPSKSLQLLYWTNVKELLPVQNIINLLPLSDHRITPIKSLTYCNKMTSKPSPVGDIMQSTVRAEPCKALQPYQFSEKKILSMRENYTFMRIVENILRSQKNNITDASHNSHFKVILYEYSFNINVVSPDNSRFNLTIPNIKINDRHNDLRDNINGVHKLSATSNLDTYYAPKVMTKPLCTSKADKRKSAVELCVNTIRTKKKSFVKLYKKCKSMSNISTNKSSMNLNKITNLEEFYLAMGSGKMLSGVLDGNAARKILSSIKELKNWMTDITPRQALLVLLLANKKDTTNLVQYRSIILQGIAVNRITRSSELDMEIEVIERENLKKLPKYEGITYLPASEENQDTLLEELCWIAKTTASDYQKQFDESSERLLKSLLAKRKKLNPSYLRVMARYVGLGLLKTSK